MSARREETIYQFLREWAKATPEAIAFASPGHEPITYRQLLDQLDSTIESLREIGIGRNDRIAIVLPNGIEMAALFLGVSCAAISVPFNPSYLENEFEFYLRDSGAKALVVQSGEHSPAVSVARRYGIPVIELVSKSNAAPDLFTLRASGSVSSAPQHTLEPDGVALILHTSGTTARPKRVPLTHRNLCASAFSIRETLALTCADRCLGVMPLFHIHGLIGGLLSTLAAGASFASIPNFDASCFFDWMEELKPTWYTAVPAIHEAILRSARDRMGTIIKSRLRVLRSSSAPLPGKTRVELEELFKVPVIEAYGMTEAAHQITSNPLPPLERRAGSVGVARDTSVGIMDEAGTLLGAGEKGEIVLRGANVTGGYEGINGTNTTAATNGWLRSGDQGYFDSDGYLFITGRLKDVINRGGEKISPRDIDEALLEHPDVLQAVAFPISHPSLGEDIAAAVVVRDATQTTEVSLRDYLSGRLAVFKVPSRLLIVDEIPKSSTGKVRRADLVQTFAERLKNGFVSPKNKLEEIVAGMYADVLGAHQIGANDHFFALGGDSLSATQVISRVRSLFSINLPIATVFLKATVAELADEIAASVKALDENSQAAICTELGVLSENNSHQYVTTKLDHDGS
jgi:acyl-CoA synthetase (AMP-forming)/AMP-acid ligase II/acyl carrier protein